MRTTGLIGGTLVVIVIHLEEDDEEHMFVRITQQGRQRLRRGDFMNRTFKRKLGDPISADSLEEIRRLTDMPDELMNTEDIPERRVGEGRVVLSLRKVTSNHAEQRKAS